MSLVSQWQRAAQRVSGRHQIAINRHQHTDPRNARLTSSATMPPEYLHLVHRIPKRPSCPEDRLLRCWFSNSLTRWEVSACRGRTACHQERTETGNADWLMPGARGSLRRADQCSASFFRLARPGARRRPSHDGAVEEPGFGAGGVQDQAMATSQRMWA